MAWTRILAVLMALLVTACAGGPPPLQALERTVDLERFMGAWYVVGSIPIFLEKGAHNAVESYRLAPDGTIETTYTFRQDAFDGPVKTFRPKGFVRNPGVNTEWGMQFIWPFKATYLIIYLDDSYSRTIIGVPSRRWVWLMSRTPELSDEEYGRLLQAAADAGYDPAKVERIPQQRTADPAAQPGK